MRIVLILAAALLDDRRFRCLRPRRPDGNAGTPGAAANGYCSSAHCDASPRCNERPNGRAHRDAAWRHRPAGS